MKTAGLVAAWLGVLALLVWWYFNTEPPRISGVEIGRASLVKGRVEFRLEQIALWSSVQPGQSLVDGSVVSTGPGGRAELRLRSGKLIELGEETQVILSTAVDLLRPDFVVNVVVGNLKV